MKLFRKPGVLILLISSFLLFVRYFFSSTESEWFYEMYGYYGSNFIEPLEIILLALFVVGVWLCFFKVEMQKSWWRIARWFGLFAAVLLGISLAMPYQGGGFISFPGIREAAVLWAVIFGLFTVIYTLARRWSTFPKPKQKPEAQPRV